MKFQDFLKTCGEALGMRGLYVDAKGACLVKVDEVALLFEWDDLLIQGTVLVSCEVCSVPVETRSVVLEAMLKQNGQSEQTLSLHPEEEMLFLHQRVHPAIDPAALREFLESFVAHVTQFRALVPTLRAQTPESQGITPPSLKA